MSTKSVQRNKRRKFNKKVRKVMRNSSLIKAVRFIAKKKNISLIEAKKHLDLLRAPVKTPAEKEIPQQRSMTIKEIRKFIQPFKVENSKLAAVKAVKVKTGLGLKEAKDIVKKLW